jgi:4-amino-4-deoxy-L-arabinose transferase-like glycosyltransferase
MPLPHSLPPESGRTAKTPLVPGSSLPGPGLRGPAARAKGPPAARSRTIWHLLAGLLILGAAGLHLLYLAWDCPLDLAPDEAHYWDWSRHLDWSYYSKGPLVAWLIRLSCDGFGPLSERLTGNLALAIRLPAVVCGALLLWSLYRLTLLVYDRAELALAVVAVGLTMPALAVGSSLMTIDAPYTCCWGWALVFGYQALFRRARWAWPMTGLLVGLGVLAKYTMILWLPSLALYMLTSREQRRCLLRPGFWSLVGITGLCCLPILIWNIQHDGVTYRHVFSLAGLQNQPEQPSSPSINWLGPLALVGGQCALLLIFWFVAWAAALWVHNPLVEQDARIRYLWWMSAPMFAVFFAFSFKTGGGELNWPVTAYLSGLVLAAAWLGRQLRSPTLWYRRLTAGCLGLTCVAGVVGIAYLHHSELLYPVLARWAGVPVPENPFPLRRLDPTCRLRGWRGGLAAAVDRERLRLQAEGVDPVLAACSWTHPGELGVYCAGHPAVYSVGSALGERHSQYDLWPGPVHQPERFLGQTFLLIGGVTPEIRGAFDHLEPTWVIHYEERGQPISAWTITVCRGFRGFAARTQGVY